MKYVHYKTCSIFLLQWLKCISTFVFLFGLKGLKIYIKLFKIIGSCEIWHLSILVRTVFYIAPTCFGIISRHLQGTGTKVCIKLKAIKHVTTGVHTL
jgi:hypothetical protein